MELLIFILIVLVAVWLATQLINTIFRENADAQRIGLIIVLVIALIVVLGRLNFVAL